MLHTTMQHLTLTVHLQKQADACSINLSHKGCLLLTPLCGDATL